MDQQIERRFSGLRVDYSGAKSDQQLVQLWLDRYAPPPDQVQFTQSGEQQPSSTQRAYRRDWNVVRQALDKVGAGSLQQVKVNHLYAALDSVGKQCSLETFRRRVFAVKSLFSFAHRTGYLQFNVASVVRPPPREETLAERILPADQIYQMISAASPGAPRILVRLLYISGLRIGEAVELKSKHLIDRPNGRVQLTVRGKRGKTRFVLLTPSMSAELKQLAGEPEEYLFRDLCPRRRSDSTRAVRVRSAQRIVSRCASVSGIGHPVSPHWMRHAHVSHALDHGAPLHVVQATVGHASPTTTSRYTHVRPDSSSADYIER